MQFVFLNINPKAQLVASYYLDQDEWWFQVPDTLEEVDLDDHEPFRGDSDRPVRSILGPPRDARPTPRPEGKVRQHVLRTLLLRGNDWDGRGPKLRLPFLHDLHCGDRDLDTAAAARAAPTSNGNTRFSSPLAS